MPKLTRVLIVLLCLAGFAGSGRAASFDFSFLSGNTSVGQGSFSFPDADLSLSTVSVKQFTSFNLAVAGRTYTLADLVYGSYLPATNSFSLDPYYRDLYYAINAAYIFLPDSTGTLALNVPTFYVDAVSSDPCYYQGLCGPQYPSVITEYNVSLDTPTGNGLGFPLYTQEYLAHFDTFLITPAASSVPEPGAASVLGASLAGLGVLIRRRRATGR